MSQKENILTHLKTGKTLTPLSAFQLYGTLALHSCVAELRADGHNIVCTMQSENGKRFGRYALEAPLAQDFAPDRDPKTRDMFGAPNS